MRCGNYFSCGIKANRITHESLPLHETPLRSSVVVVVVAAVLVRSSRGKCFNRLSSCYRGQRDLATTAMQIYPNTLLGVNETGELIRRSITPGDTHFAMYRARINSASFLSVLKYTKCRFSDAFEQWRGILFFLILRGSPRRNALHKWKGM